MLSLRVFLDAHLSKIKSWRDFYKQTKIKDFIAILSNAAIKKTPCRLPPLNEKLGSWTAILNQKCANFRWQYFFLTKITAVYRHCVNSLILKICRILDWTVQLSLVCLNIHLFKHFCDFGGFW